MALDSGVFFSTVTSNLKESQDSLIFEFLHVSFTTIELRKCARVNDKLAGLNRAAGVSNATEQT